MTAAGGGLYRATATAGSVKRELQAGVEHDEVKEVSGGDREAMGGGGEGRHAPTGGAPAGDAGADGAGLNTIQGVRESPLIRAQDEHAGIARGEVVPGAAAWHGAGV